MADNKKYYYMKLKENFFDSEEMILLESMPDGYLYSNILLKLYLRSLKDGGCLMFKGVIPYTPDVLSRVVRHNVGVVEKAIQVFRQLGLVEILDNGAIYMLDIQNFIGESSTEADRKRLYRSKIENEKRLLGQMSGQTSDESTDKSPPEIEIELKIEREKELKKNMGQPDGRPTRSKFIPPTLEEVIDYCNERGKGVDPQKWYDHYTSNGWKVGKNPMKDWRAAVRTWERTDYPSGYPRGPKQEVARQSNYQQTKSRLDQLLEEEEAKKRGACGYYQADTDPFS